MAAATFWNAERMAKFREMWDQGYTYEAIGRVFGKTAKATEKARLRHGLPAKYEWKPPAIVSADPPRSRSVLPESCIPWPSKQQLMARR